MAQILEGLARPMEISNQSWRSDAARGQPVRAPAVAPARTEAPALDGFDSRASLRRGAVGPAVRLLQRRLRALGLIAPGGLPTGLGVFGPVTEKAVMTFQARRGLPATGAVDAATHACLTQAFSVGARASFSATSRFDGKQAFPGVRTAEPGDPIAFGAKSNPDDRSATRYLEVINQFAVAENPRYAARAGRTFAAQFARDVMRAMAAPVAGETDAARLAGWLERRGPQFGWNPATAEQAQAHANLGKPALAAVRTEAGGHVAVVRPAPGSRGLTVAQAGGRRLLTATVSEAFGLLTPRFWIHA